VHTTRNNEARKLMSPEEVAEYLGCGRTFAFELLKTGEIPSLKLGRLRRVRRVDVDDYIERRLRETKP
jgi:excisionase family DNA binding protein